MAAFFKVAESVAELWRGKAIQPQVGATFFIQCFFFARKKALVPGLHKAKPLPVCGHKKRRKNI